MKNLKLSCMTVILAVLTTFTLVGCAPDAGHNQSAPAQMGR